MCQKAFTTVFGKLFNPRRNEARPQLCQNHIVLAGISGLGKREVFIILARNHSKKRNDSTDTRSLTIWLIVTYFVVQWRIYENS